MKNQIKIALLMIAFAAVSCGKDGFGLDGLGPEGNGNQSDSLSMDMGVLSFAEWNLSVAMDQEVSTDEQQPLSRASYATMDADGDYIVRVVNSKLEEVYNKPYSETVGIEIPLPRGVYTVSAECPNYAGQTDAAWSTPVYYGRTSVTIGADPVTVNPLTCHLDNIKTTVEIAADLEALFKADDGTDKLTVSVGVGDNTLTYGRGDFVTEAFEGKMGYFRAPETKNTLHVALVGAYNKAAADEVPSSPVTWNQEIPNVTKGQWRKIRISMLHASDGNVQLQLSVETWVYDEQIDVDVNSFALYALGEEEIDENGGGDGGGEITNPGDTGTGPSVVWQNGDFEQRYTLTGDPLPVVIQIDSETGITGLIVEVSGEILPALVQLQLGGRLDLVSPNDTMNGMLMELGFPTREMVAGKTSLEFNITEFTSMIPMVAAGGDSDFKLIVTDANGTTERTIRFAA